jgi:membrane protease YdiL (CAAX protease family)
MGLEATAGRSADRAGGDVAWFAALAFGFSWAWLVPLALTGRHVGSGAGSPTHVPAEFGPLLAAFVVTAWRQGRPGMLDLLKRMVRFEVPLRWWLFAVSPLMLLGVVLIVQVGLRQSVPSAGDFATFSGLPSAWGVVGVGAALVVMALGEETGWRGYALPHLQYHHSPLRATVVVAAIWVLWHAPMFLVVDTYRSFNAAITVGWTMDLFCGAVVLSWLYNRSGGSILLVAVWHASYNLISGTDAAGAGLLAATSTTLVIALAITLVSLEIRAGRRGRASVLAPHVVIRHAESGRYGAGSRLLR